MKFYIFSALVLISSLSHASDEKIKQCWNESPKKEGEIASLKEVSRDFNNVLNTFIKLLEDVTKKEKLLDACVAKEMNKDAVFQEAEKKMQAKGQGPSQTSAFHIVWVGAKDPEYIEAKRTAKAKAEENCKDLVENLKRSRSAKNSYSSSQLKDVIGEMKLKKCAGVIRLYPNNYINAKVLNLKPESNGFTYVYQPAHNRIDGCGDSGESKVIVCKETAKAKVDSKTKGSN